MGNLQELERRVADLEARQQLLLDVIFALADKAEPEGAQFALLALINGFTAQEMDALHQLFGEAIRRGSENLTRETFVREFTARLPHRAEKLEPIMRAYRADGTFPGLCRLVLGEAGESEKPPESCGT